MEKVAGNTIRIHTFKNIILLILLIPSTALIFTLLDKYRALPTEAKLIDYELGSQIYVDRDYYDTVRSEVLVNLKLVQLPRHLQFRVLLRASENANFTIYRLLPDRNNNQEFENWDKTDIPIFVNGHTCNITSIIRKEFYAKEIILEAGGPVASSPILIDSTNNIEASVMANFWQYLQLKIKSYTTYILSAIILMLTAYIAVLNIKLN